MDSRDDVRAGEGLGGGFAGVVGGVDGRVASGAVFMGVEDGVLGAVLDVVSPQPVESARARPIEGQRLRRDMEISRIEAGCRSRS
jgi:hypothetical protein